MSWWVLVLVAWLFLSVVTALVFGAVIRRRDSDEAPRDHEARNDESQHEGC